MEGKIPRFTAVFEKSGKWYLGWIEEIPGVNTQGKTLEEAKENLQEALTMVLEARREQRHHPRHSHHRVIRTMIAPTMPYRYS